MGNSNNNKQPQQPVQTLEDRLLDIQMNAKRMEKQSAKATKQAKQEMEKAKKALKQNKQHEAKIFLQNYNIKTQESQKLLTMSNQMYQIKHRIESNTQDQELQRQVQKIIPILQSQSYEQNQMLQSNQTEQFQQLLDELSVNANIQNDLMNQPDQEKSNLDQMMKELQKEVNFEVEQELEQNQQHNFQNIKTSQQQQVQKN